MADTKITALTAISTNPVNPATFPIPMVDLLDTSMAASGTTKKVTVNQILGSGGTATLASATITGDLTVDTTTLVVNPSGYADRVGIGTATPALPLDVAGGMQVTSGSAGGLYQWAYGASASSRSWRAWNDVSANGDFQISTSTTRTGSTYSDRYRIDVTGVHEWSNTSGLAMTLNSTGLGIGRGPLTSLDVFGANKTNTNEHGTLTVSSSDAFAIDKGGSIAFFGKYNTASGNACFARVYGAKENATDGNFVGYFAVATGGGGSPVERFRIDSSGNVGIGVTPSAWGNQYRALQIFNNSALYGASAYGYYGLLFNGYNDNTDIKAIASLYVGEYRYEVTTGAHKWFGTTANATAGATAAPTQAMTLESSGRLLLGKTASALGTVGLESAAGGFTQSTVTSDASLFCNRLATDGETIKFYRQTLQVGNISVTTTATAYNTSSDYRLKEDAQPLVGGLARVNALKPSIYKWKVNGSTGEGFLAHELAEVVPTAVTGEKDAVNEDGSINAQSIDMSRIVPILVAAIQELTTRVQTLEAR